MPFLTMPFLTGMRLTLDEASADHHEAMAVAFWLQMASIATLATVKKPYGGSEKRKAPNITRDYYYSSAHLHYMVKYFWPSTQTRPGTNQRGPEEPEPLFECRFRMSMGMFNRVFTAVVSKSAYLRQGLRPDATGKLGITPLLKVICALRQLAYGIPADLADDLFDVSKTTASLCLIEFCEAVVSCFSPKYLRSPTPQDLQRIEREFSKVGFPGCIGCLDCAGWDWKNCPKALQEIMVRKDGKPTVRMEVVCSLDLWIWSFQFGLPEAFNDLNILEVSNHFQEVLCGTFPPVYPSYTISGKNFNWFYYLTDGIYPSWKIFLKTLIEPSDRKAKLFCKSQEGVRKCVERVFGVLFRRFKLLFVASEYWSVSKMKWLATACVCLHNMIVEERRDFYSSDGSGGMSTVYERIEDLTDITFQRCESGTTPPSLSTNPYVSDGCSTGARGSRPVYAGSEGGPQ